MVLGCSQRHSIEQLSRYQCLMARFRDLLGLAVKRAIYFSKPLVQCQDSKLRKHYFTIFKTLRLN